MGFVAIRGLASIGAIAKAAAYARQAIGKVPGVGIDAPKEALDKLRWLKAGGRDFRTVNDQLVREMSEVFTKALLLVMRGKADITKPWLAAGKAYHERVTQRLANSGDDVKMRPLKPETIRRKGSSQIGRDTGALYRLWKASQVRLTK